MEARRERSFRAHPSALAGVRHWLRETATDRGVSRPLAEELVIAVNEACTNAVLHSRGDRVDLTWRDDDDRVEVEIRDGGMFRPIPLVGQWEETGRGIPVMISAADELSIRKGTEDYPGTIVRIRKRKVRASEQPPEMSSGRRESGARGAAAAG